MTEELETDGPDVLRHLVQQPARRRDHAIAAFLLHARQAAQEFVRDVLAETCLAELSPLDVDPRGAKLARFLGRLASILPYELERSHFGFVDLSAVVPKARDFEPVPVRIDHAPPHEIVDGRTPEHRLLAAGIHRDVAADTRGIGRSRIDCEHETGLLRRICHPARHDTRFAEDRRDRS